MNLTSPLPKVLAEWTELPGYESHSLLKAIQSTVFLSDDGPDGGIGLLISGLAGVAAALAVAIMISVYFRSGYRTTRDIVRHGLAAALVFALLAFVVSDMRNAALAYLGISPA